MGDDDDERRHGYTVDDALSTLGFGNFQRLALAFAGIGWCSDAMEISLLSFIGPALKSEWLISSYEESLLSSAVFGGMFIGSYFWGFIADVYGRRMGIRGVTIITSGAGLLSAFAPDYKSLVILRFIVGFAAAGGHVFQSWFLEFIPKSNRGAWMLATSLFWVLGELLEASLFWIVMPRLGWRWSLALSCVPSLTMFIVSTLAPESPRYLFMKGKTNEAIGVLEKVALMNKKELPTGNLVPDHQRTLRVDLEEHVPSDVTHLLSSNEKQTTSTVGKSLLYLFSSEFLGTTLLLCLVNFAYSFSYYGLQLMISGLSSGQSDCGPSNSILSKNVPKDTLYLNVLITYIAELQGLILAVVLIDRLGRKLSVETLTMLSVVLILPLLSHQNGTVTVSLLIGVRMFLSAAFSTLGVYAKEVYPTSVRVSGSGLVTSVGKIGGMICPLVAVGLVRECHQTLAAIVFGIVMLISGICVIYFRFEMKGRALSDFEGNIE
ncbi:hypothetical protein BUALT_Bualt09G0048900 [Buddleja alternifolia]|uniref:Major facilitator superfamily (MFS) profile domain-containing protein n=1 Tax=Buddleja alternifolia TaxID=168488 RepID=A0AAV6XAR9_9LAMI|nr:hypothetical protein BUALT_Bualt09G0048900 [Buddleja alternifolia]